MRCRVMLAWPILGCEGGSVVQSSGKDNKGLKGGAASGKHLPTKFDSLVAFTDTY